MTAHFFLYNVSYAATKFEVAKSYGLVGDAFSKNAFFDLDLAFTRVYWV